MSSIRQFINRAASVLLPHRVNEILYALDSTAPLHNSKEKQTVASWNIVRYDRKSLSGNQRTDMRIERGDVCYAVLVNGVVVHESWVLFHVRLPSLFGFEKTPVIGDCVTAPEFRRCGIYSSVLAHIADDLLQREGIRSIQILVSPENEASKHGIAKAGFQFVKHLSGVRFFGLFILPPPRLRGRNRSPENEIRNTSSRSAPPR